MSLEPPAKFFVNSGLVSSPTDIYNLLRPLLKQTVSYRYFRGPVSFQVYTPRDLGRPPMRGRIPAFAEPPKKTSLGVRVGLALLGGLVVLLTAAAVIGSRLRSPNDRPRRS